MCFETGKAKLTAESQAQLRNIAAILKAFPDSDIKFGDYTDNVGKVDANLLLSIDRANAAMQYLTTNDPPEGRAQTRRVDVRITKE